MFLLYFRRIKAFLWTLHEFYWLKRLLVRRRGSRGLNTQHILQNRIYNKWWLFLDSKWYFLSSLCQKWRKIQPKFQVCPSVWNWSIDQILCLLIHLNLTKSNFPIWIIGNFGTKCHPFIIALFIPQLESRLLCYLK